ncbi:hypothetical protein [Parafilimonas sp.]|uniref:hypothetical protein n=1 Tax=Parafilimonas sp. TaxID=1969739 RepID=UPI003F81DADE
MKQNEGLPFIKFMMLLSSMTPLFLLVGIRGIQIKDGDNLLISPKHTWTTIACLIVIPYLVIKFRIYFSKKASDIYPLNVQEATLNKEYLFTYLFTVLLPLYSVSISSLNEFYAVICAIAFVIFVLWNMNMHFINIFFAFGGYRVFTLPNQNGAVLLTTRQNLSNNIQSIKAHRLSNSVFIELKNYSYDNK